MAEGVPQARPRDPRLDVFRGASMFIIMISHVPWNHYADWIPGRFGFSDAAEIFVFCSGLAAAIAFGGTFARHGFAAGVARIAFRCWQLYWAHVAVFLVIAAMMIAVDGVVDWKSHVEALNLDRFLAEPARHLIGFLTLTYVPNYFDILPMYIAMLAMVPGAILLHRAGGVPAVAAASLVLWLAAHLGIAFPADPNTDRPWFFNPLGWQILFFTGFALGRGWLPAPPVRPALVVLAALLVAACVPFAWGKLFEPFPALGAIHGALAPLRDKTDMGALRLVHFFALAYLAYAACGPGGARLTGPVSALFARVGQQTLAVFLAGLVLSQAMGVVLDVWGRHALALAVVNLAGCVLLVAVAEIARFFRIPPWLRRERAGASLAGAAVPAR